MATAEAWDELLACNDGDGHHWLHPSDPEVGMTCAGCGLTEAELDQLLAQKRRSRARDKG